MKTQKELINEYKDHAKKVKFMCSHKDLDCAKYELKELKRLSANSKMRIIELAGIETVSKMQKGGYVISTSSESYYYTRCGEIGYSNTIANQSKF